MSSLHTRLAIPPSEHLIHVNIKFDSEWIYSERKFLCELTIIKGTWWNENGLGWKIFFLLIVKLSAMVDGFKRICFLRCTSEFLAVLPSDWNQQKLSCAAFNYFSEGRSFFFSYFRKELRIPCTFKVKKKIGESFD